MSERAWHHLAARRVTAAAALVGAIVAALVVAPAGAAAGGPPTVAVRPDTNLVEGQRVRVVGDGWRPGTLLVVIQCDGRATSLRGCDSANAALVQPSGDRWATDLPVDRGIETEAFGFVDCAGAHGACVVAVAARVGRLLAEAPIHFDPDGPPPELPPHLDVDVAPTARLRPDGRTARVVVHVTCEPAQHLFVEVELSQDGGEDDPRGFASASVDACHGTVTVALDVRAAGGVPFRAGAARVTAEAVGFRDPDDEGAVDVEVADVAVTG